MEMILLDWTRMGKTYCLAGAVREARGWRVVRPLLLKQQSTAVRNVGWSPYLLDGHCRWEVFEMVGAVPAAPEAPHLEDVWVRSLRPLKRLAAPATRREVLEATRCLSIETAFGEPPLFTRTAAYLRPGTGSRSLTTLVVPTAAITFRAACREGAGHADFRVSLDLPGLSGRSLPVKDHFMLMRTEEAGESPEAGVKALSLALRQMGDPVAVRLGLSRGFSPVEGATHGYEYCWLMADGFFSLTDPQP